jgi:hypothetical protein
VKRKIDAGRRAINRLKAIDEALVTSSPLRNPFTTNLNTFTRGTPSKPGRVKFLILCLSSEAAETFIVNPVWP